MFELKFERKRWPKPTVLIYHHQSPFVLTKKPWCVIITTIFFISAIPWQFPSGLIREKIARLCFSDCCHRQSLDASFFPVPTSFYLIAMPNPQKTPYNASTEPRLILSISKLSSIGGRNLNNPSTVQAGKNPSTLNACYAKAIIQPTTKAA